jgi:hypothetical protein
VAPFPFRSSVSTFVLPPLTQFGFAVQAAPPLTQFGFAVRVVPPLTLFRGAFSVSQFGIDVCVAAADAVRFRRSGRSGRLTQFCFAVRVAAAKGGPAPLPLV